jgi:uncharacterized protein (TIGR03435 family)
MNKTLLVMAVTGAMTAAAAPVISQTQPPKLAFEVVSVKLSPPDAGYRVSGPGGNKYYTVTTLRALLRTAYLRTTPRTTMADLAVQSIQREIIRGPKWMDSVRWDVEATMDCSAGPYSFEQLQQLIQSMLEERFQLKVHTETRQVPIYNLVVAKDGPKIKSSADQTPTRLTALSSAPRYCGPGPAESPLLPGPPPGQRGSLADRDFILPRGSLFVFRTRTGRAIRGKAVSLANLINNLQPSLGRPVVDKTNLEGLFDFIMHLPDEVEPAGPPDPVPSIITALQELGLKLEAAKGPVEVLVINSVQKPKEN